MYLNMFYFDAVGFRECRSTDVCFDAHGNLSDNDKFISHS